MATYPLIWVNGISMDDPSGRWGVRREQTYRSLPGLRATNVVVPGRSGSLYPAYDPYENNSFRLSLIVFGQGANIQAKTADLEANLEALNFLVSQYPVNLRYKMGPNTDDVRFAKGRVTASTTPDVYPGRDYATVDYIFDLPDVFWQDLAYRYQENVVDLTNGNRHDVNMDFMAGGTAPVDDLEIIVAGPWANLRVTANQADGNFDGNIGTRIACNSAIDQYHYVYINCGTMRAWRVTGTFGGNPGDWDTIPKIDDMTNEFFSQGVYSATYWLRFLPNAGSGTFTNPADRKIILGMSAGTTDPDKSVFFRGRRAFL